MNTEKSAGFSLVGMALFMMVVAIGVSTLSLMAPNIETIGREKTVAALRANKSALIGYATANGRLPNATEFGSVVPNPLDGYQNTIQYAFDSRLVTTGAVCATPSAYLSVDSLSSVALVIWSQGRNGQVNNATTTPDKSAGAMAASTTFPNSVYSNNGTPNDITDDTDDLLEWVTLDELKKYFGCQDLEASTTLFMVANALPVGFELETYGTFTFTAQGGSGSGYQWCVESSAIASGLLNGDLSFASPASVAVVGSGACGSAFVSDSSTTLTMTAASEFDLGDGSATGTSHEIRIYLKDGVGNSVNRLFPLTVRSGMVSMGKSYASEYLSTATSTATGDDIYTAQLTGTANIGVSWSQDSRFSDNGDGSITDNLTGLSWLQNANCWGNLNWIEALDQVTALNSRTAGYNCTTSPTYTGTATDWRLPNRRELSSLLHMGRYSPAIPVPTSGLPAPENVQNDWYWTSTSYAISQPVNNAWAVNLDSAAIASASKSQSYDVWPVRGGQ
ncbi:MAG: DUF1566 domain-containing protein [Magnetococcales bacterium]|nr:DUF1566 domain-containing protein [Magnetococcales bacterium]